VLSPRENASRVSASNNKNRKRQHQQRLRGNNETPIASASQRHVAKISNHYNQGSKQMAWGPWKWAAGMTVKSVRVIAPKQAQ
jgi:hypothetical protein